MPVTCADVDGDFPGPRLTPDDSSNLPDDPVLSFSPGGGGQIQVRFAGDSRSFPVTCSQVGRHVVINFTRTDNSGTTTEYTALFTRKLKPGANTLRFRGRFERTTPAVAPGTTTGDWETEKPT